MNVSGAECGQGGRVSTCEGLDHPIDPAQWNHSQIELFSVPIIGPQLVHQRQWYVLSVLSVGTCIYKSLLLIGKSSLYGKCVFPPKKYLRMTISLMFNSQ